MTMPSGARDFYVYAFLRSKDSEHGAKYSPYYIGKGCRHRAYTRFGRICPAPVDRSLVVFIQEGLTEQEAFALEAYCIKLYGRIDIGTGILRNLTDGGDGVSGYKHSESTRRILSFKRKGRESTMKGRRHSLQSRIRMSQSAKGRVMKEETKQKIANANTGKKRSEETRQRIVESRIGKRHSDETRAKISENRKGKTAGENNPQWGNKGEKNHNWGRVVPEETRRKISEAHKGKKMPPLTEYQINKRVTMRAKNLYELIDSNGDVYMTTSIDEFARQYGLTASCLNKLLNGKIKSYKGWKIKIAERLR